jgi:HD-GYP domain-containing protein (c-di-GMP phosphodiesterase class II)
MTPATAAPRGFARGFFLLLAGALGAGLVWLAPPSARAALWAASLGLVSLLAAGLLVRMERRTRALEAQYHGALDIMSRIIDSVERYAENHSRRVAEASMEVARALGCSEDEVEDIRVAALLHDLGKLDLPVDALATAAGLTPGELADAGFYGRPAGSAGRGALRLVMPMVACCQERWDGTGRRALRGREIPLGARIIAVADAYDALVTDRPYQKGRTAEEAHAALLGASGAQFDPLVVDVFLRLRGTAAVEIPEARAA